MAKGIFTQSGTVSANADTPLTITPGLGERIYVLMLNISVSVAGTTSRAIVSDGVGGAVIARMATTAADSEINLYFAVGDPSLPGFPLAAVAPGQQGNVLNLNTTGGAAATLNYTVTYQVR